MAIRLVVVAVGDVENLAHRIGTRLAGRAVAPAEVRSVGEPVAHFGVSPLMNSEAFIAERATIAPLIVARA